jgi:hypothetical protein
MNEEQEPEASTPQEKDGPSEHLGRKEKKPDSKPVKKRGVATPRKPYRPRSIRSPK